MFQTQTITTKQLMSIPWCSSGVCKLSIGSAVHRVTCCSNSLYERASPDWGDRFTKMVKTVRCTDGALSLENLGRP